uniref:Synaptotagmin-like protein 1 n=1 Tax=Acanthochromis polyacanthus TaxID=80966 RepID=A0A3Q1GBG2_9TELE
RTAVIMIDLSFLSEEEQETVLSVLKRDAELKKTEEQRVQNLQKTVSDKTQLRYLTGEWFYETKQLRHPDRIHGSDIIRASLRHTHKPLTLCESAISTLLRFLIHISYSENFGLVDNGARQDNIAKTEVGGSQCPQTISQKKNINKNVSPRMEMTVGQSEDKSLSPQTVGSVLVKLSRDDGTYRANPVFIDEETCASLTGSQVSGSISSIYPSDFGDIEVQGSIQFAVNYIQNLGEFHIFVVLCRDLAVADNKKNCSDPYVKCYLLPDKTKLGKRKTTVKKKMLNPTYNEILKVRILYLNLNISVWHNNTFGRNSFLGEVDLDLSEWDFRNTQINDFTLKPRFVSFSFIVRIHYHGLMAFTGKTTSRMKTGEVQIWVKDCKNLPPVRGDIIDPFVKCIVLPDTSRKSRQKTRVVKRTVNPMFNHTMVYDGFRPEDLREACVEITVWDYDRLHNHYIGGLRLGLGTGKSYGVEVAWMDSTPDEANLWQRMLQSDGEWVEDDLPLRTLMMAKTMSK